MRIDVRLLCANIYSGAVKRIQNKRNKMPTVTLYSLDVSPPVRAVILTAKLIDLPLNNRDVNLIEREQMSKEFKKVNPTSMVPAIDDNGFTLGDSHAISCYLVGKYAKNDALYPKDLQTRARVDHFLHMDSMLFIPAKMSFKPLLLGLANSIPEDTLQFWRDGYNRLNEALEGKKWLVGDSYTLADITCATTTAAATAVLNIDDYPNVKAWFERAEKEIPGFKELNDTGNKKLVEMIRSKLA
ncbi:glutathione S-transferase 1 isoform X1 [Megalopta genalis]|uniref:glutathione S-transferase 1 isoform X1 n=2 Tax=Megalopta genalis TaxID=115081 RepID=UPI003FD32421